MQIHNAIITGSFSYNGADLSNVTSSNAYSASLSSRTTDLESTSSVLVGASSSFSSILSSVSSSQQQLSSSFLTLTASFNAVSASQQQVSASYIALSASYNTFSGSASTRITVDSASLLQVSASYIALSGSYNTFSGSASTRVSQIEQVYATTGSNSFRATQSITGSLTVTGQIIAQTINVQQVTSSIIYSSGSNNFGCDLNSRQTFTGSVLITGSLTIAGGSSANSYSGTTIYGSTAVCSPVGKFTSCIDVGGAGTFSGNLTLAASTPGLVLNDISGTAAGSIIFQNSGTQKFNLTTLATSNNFALYNNGGTNSYNLQIVYSTGAATFSSTITGTTIYGSTAVCSPVGKFTSCIDVGGAGTFSGNVTNVSALYVRASGNSDLPFINFSNADGVYNWGRVGGLLQGDGDGSLYFQTKLGGSLGTRLTITSTGASTFSSTITANGGNILSCGASYGIVQVKGSGASTWQMFANPSDEMRFGRSGVGDYLTITSGGVVLINTTTAIACNRMYIALGNTETFRAGTWETQSYNVNNAWIGENVYYDGNFKYRVSGYANAVYSDSSSGLEIRVAASGGTGCAVTWKNGATFAPDGNVYNYSNTTTWQQTSDIKIKENINSLTNGLNTILSLRPVTFDYKEEFSNSVNWEDGVRLNNVGFIAQEFEEVFPKYVGSSERKINGEFKTLKNIDTNHLVSYLVKGMQEQQCTICSQASMINTLKTCLGII